MEKSIMTELLFCDSINTGQQKYKKRLQAVWFMY